MDLARTSNFKPIDVTRELIAPGLTKRFMPIERELHSRGELSALDLSERPGIPAGGELRPLELHRHEAPDFKPAASRDALEAPARPSNTDAELRKQAQNFVSQAFFGTLLKQMRNSPFRSELFDGGRGGQAYGALYDQHLAERMARGAGNQLVDSIVRQFKARRAYDAQASNHVKRVGAAEGRGHAPAFRG